MIGPAAATTTIPLQRRLCVVDGVVREGPPDKSGPKVKGRLGSVDKVRRAAPLPTAHSDCPPFYSTTDDPQPRWGGGGGQGQGTAGSEPTPAGETLWVPWTTITGPQAPNQKRMGDERMKDCSGGPSSVGWTKDCTLGPAPGAGVGG